MQQQANQQPQFLPDDPPTISVAEMKDALEKTFGALIGNLTVQNLGLKKQAEALQAKIADLERAENSLATRIQALEAELAELKAGRYDAITPEEAEKV